MKKFIAKMHNWFEDYTAGYLKDADRENIILKVKHTERVVNDIKLISRELGLNEQQTEIAELCGLLHDIGRFEQYRQYGTFSDGRSVNHAEFGVQILKREKILEELPAYSRALILTAILYHNRLHLPDDETEEVLLYSKLLRDADKLDIFKVVTDYYKNRHNRRNETLELDLPEKGKISSRVFEAVQRREEVDFNKIRNFNDFKLLQAGWVYGINYVPTLRLFDERRYLEQLEAALIEEKETRIIFAEIRGYLNERLQEAGRAREAE